MLRIVLIITCLVSLGATAVTQIPSGVERRYDPAKDETTYILKQVRLEDREDGQFDMSAYFSSPGKALTKPAESIVLAVLWIGNRRMFSVPAIMAVEIDGELIYREQAKHHAEQEGRTIDENVWAEIAPATLKRMVDAKRVVLRVDDVRFRLQDTHLARLRELLSFSEGKGLTPTKP